MYIILVETISLNNAIKILIIKKTITNNKTKVRIPTMYIDATGVKRLSQQVNRNAVCYYRHAQSARQVFSLLTILLVLETHINCIFSQRFLYNTIAWVMNSSTSCAVTR